MGIPPFTVVHTTSNIMEMFNTNIILIFLINKYTRINFIIEMLHFILFIKILNLGMFLF